MQMVPNQKQNVQFSVTLSCLSSTVNAYDTVHAVHAPPPRQHSWPQHSQLTPSPLPCRSQTPAAPSHRPELASFCWLTSSSVQRSSLSSSLLIVSKLEHRQVDAFSLPAGSRHSSLIFLQDELSGRHFLVGTGASVSLVHATTSSTASSERLLTADGYTVSSSGSRIIPLHFGSWNCAWLFHLSPVSVPILGADFLQHLVKSQKVFSSSSSDGSVISLPSSPPSTSSTLHSAFL